MGFPLTQALDPVGEVTAGCIEKTKEEVFARELAPTKTNIFINRFKTL